MRSEEWDRTLTFSNNLSVRIYGHEGPSGVGAIYLKYSDEATPRMIAGSWDYVGPYAIRFDQQLRVLFIKQSGLSAGVFKETILCEYDLQRRTMLHQVHISNPSLLH